MSKKQATDTTSIALDELLKTLKSIGYEKTLNALRNARITSEINQPHLAFVASAVCTGLNYSLKQITDRYGFMDESYCRGFIVFYLRTYFRIKWRDLEPFLNRNQSHLFKNMQLISGLNPKLSQHKSYWLFKGQMDDLVSKYQKSLST